MTSITRKIKYNCNLCFCNLMKYYRRLHIFFVHVLLYKPIAYSLLSQSLHLLCGLPQLLFLSLATRTISGITHEMRLFHSFQFYTPTLQSPGCHNDAHCLVFFHGRGSFPLLSLSLSSLFAVSNLNININSIIHDTYIRLQKCREFHLLECCLTQVVEICKIPPLVQLIGERFVELKNM